MPNSRTEHLKKKGGGSKKRIIGVGRLILHADRKRGEFATVVADDHQGKGLGGKLTDMLIEVAQEKKLESVYGEILLDNYGMIRFCEALGFETRREGDQVVAELRMG